MDKIRRKLDYALDDIRGYWIPKAKAFLLPKVGYILYVPCYILIAAICGFLPRKKSQAVLNFVGRVLWSLKDIPMLPEKLPPMRNMVYVLQMRGDAVVMEDYGFNLRTNQGTDWQCDRMGKAPASGTTIAAFISVHSASGYTPATGDTEAGNWRTNEVTSNGFGRVAGAYAHTTGTGLYTLQTTYTCTGAPVTGYGAALLDTTPTGGNGFCIRNFGTPATMAVNDTLQVTWSITV